MPAVQAELKISQYLNEAHATEQALVTTLRAHVSMTPRGSYREALAAHLAETQEHARLVQERIGEIRAGRNLVRLAVGAADLGIGVAETLTGQFIALWKAPIDLLRGMSAEEKLLKNAKDECATEALEIATYDSLERLAREVGDRETAELAARIRGDEERFLARLRKEIPALVEAVVGAELQGRPTYRADQTGAADAVRRVARRTARAGSRATRTAGRQVEQTADRTVEAAQAAADGAAAQAESAVGAAAEQAEEAGRRTARTARSVRRRAGEQSERQGRARRERSARQESSSRRTSGTASRAGSGRSSRHSSRRSEEAAAQREPWPGYDAQTAPQIRETLGDSNEQTAARVLEYEREHKDRTTVEQAAEREIQEG